MKLLSGYQDIRINKEDFVLTPYLSLFFVNGKILSVYGISITWMYYSFYIGMGFGIPKNYPSFINLKNHNKQF